MEAHSVEMDAVFAAGGEVGAVMRQVDWSRTLLGDVAGWPQSLRTAVSIVLASRHPLIVWWGPDLVMLYNDALAPSFGENHPAAVGRPGSEVLPEMWPVIGPMLEGVLANGQATWRTDEALPMVRRGFVEDTYWTYSYSPIRVESGAVGGVFTATSETTQRVRAHQTLEDQHLVLELIAQGADVHEALEVLARSGEQQSSDGAVVAVLLASQDGRALHHGAAPSLPAAYNDAIDGIAIGEGFGSCGTAAHRRETVIVSDITTDPLWQDFRELGVAHGLRACWSIPILSARRVVLGTFAVYHREPHQPLAEERRRIGLLARTAGIAIARDHQDRALSSHLRTLQRSLLPPSLPKIPGIQLAAGYYPAYAAEQVGGDFYDVIKTAGGCVALIGDVCGKGAQAAALTSHARYTLRAAARIDPTPSRMLQFLHETLLTDGYDRFCTVLVAHLTVRPDGLRATIALGGHPRPLLLTRDEAPRFVGTPGTLIGAIPEISISDFELKITREQSLVLYTDGATDARIGTERLDESGLLEAVAGAELTAPAETLRIIEQALFAPDVKLPDDVALLCARPT